MRFSCPVLLLALASAMTFAPTSTAQVSKAMSPHARIQSLKNDVSPEKSKADLQKTAADIRSQCESILDVLDECGQELANADGPFEDDRGRFREWVNVVLREVQNVDNEGRLLSEDVSSDNCTDLKLAANMLATKWEGLNKQIEETRKFLNQGLNAANTLRNDVGKAGELVEQQSQEAAKKETEAKEKSKALYMKWIDANVKSVEAFEKQKEAYSRWRDFVKGGGDKFSDKALDLIIKWDEAMDDVKEQKIAEFEAFQDMTEASEDLNDFYKERATADENLRKFIESISSNDANRAWSEFDAWVRLFEKDVGG